MCGIIFFLLTSQAVQWIGGSRSPGDLHRNAAREGVSQGAGQQKRSQRAIENDIRGLLRNFGLKVGIVGIVGFEQRIRDLVEGVPELADIMEPLLAARRVLGEKFAKLHRKVLLLARDNEVCQRLMTIPGVGPVSRVLVLRKTPLQTSLTPS
jgi:transposase